MQFSIAGLKKSAGLLHDFKALGNQHLKLQLLLKVRVLEKLKKDKATCFQQTKVQIGLFMGFLNSVQAYFNCDRKVN